MIGAFKILDYKEYGNHKTYFLMQEREPYWNWYYYITYLWFFHVYFMQKYTTTQNNPPKNWVKFQAHSPSLH